MTPERPDLHEESTRPITALDRYLSARSTYIVPLVCTNCGWRGRKKFDKGTRVGGRCPVCECSHTLVRTSR